MLINGDCLNAFKQIADQSIDAIITDPPYNIGETSLIVGKDFSHFEKIIYPSDYLSEFYRVMKDESTLICFYNDRAFDELLTPARSLFEILQIGVWHKINPPPRIRGVGFQWAHELFLIARKGNKSFYDISLGQRHSVLRYPLCIGDERTDHPTQKPLALIKELVLRFTRPDDCVLDPFMGSGTLIEACINTGRRYIGIEINPEYFAIAEQRSKNSQLCLIDLL